MRLSRFLFAILAIAATATVHAADPFYLKDGDRVVFYGDSITDQRLYTTFAETYVLTRFPKLKIDFIHSGWGGDRVTGGGGGKIDVRLRRDVIAYKPTVMTIMLGMNDASYQLFKPAIFDTYAKGYGHIIEVLKDELPNLHLTLIVPSPFDDVSRPPQFEGGYNAVLLKYGEFVKNLAKTSGATVADLNASVVEATKKAFAKDPELAKRLNPDRIHPAPAGQLLMAAALLKAWNAPALVSSVTIDPKSDAPVKAEHATIQAFGVKDGAISWNQLDDALPFPIDLTDPVTKLAVASSSILDDLDRQVLKVAGLEKAEYSLKIDGKAIGTFSKEELANGINLATLATPMRDQAKAVHTLTLEHNNMHFYRWRQIQVPFEKDAPSDVEKAIEGLDGIEARIVARQRAAAKPKTHKFEVAPKG